MNKFMIINGPNLNKLGERESLYGDFTLKEVESYTRNLLLKEKIDLNLTWWQSNSESEIIDKIHDLSLNNYDALIINPAAYSHTSIAILDALKTFKNQVVEVHISNVYQRENFRQTLLTAKASSIIMCGLGKDAYYFGVKALLK